MNIILTRFCIVILSSMLLIYLFARFAPKTWSKQIYKTVTWLIDIAFIYFVNFFIFFKPWKEHKNKVGVYVWLFLVFIIIRYLCAKQPLTTEIKSPYLAFIGYIYFMSFLYLIKFIFEFSIKDIKTTD
jgi:hypothetical protein